MRPTKTIFILLVVFVIITTVQAQNYQISFAGSGASTIVDSVQVQNLTKGTSLTLNGSDILNLTGTTDIKTATIGNESLQIYPNPMTTTCNVEFEIIKAGLVSVDLFDITGKKVNSFQNNLASGLHTLTINGLNSGVYALTLTTEDGNYSGKIVSNNKVAGTVTINYVNSEETPTNNTNSTVETTETTKLRSAQTTVNMSYSTGDRILLKGMSGNYSNIISIIPISSSTQTFNFVAATDCDGNNYTTVTIGTQTWMVENLKTTKYNDCTTIPNVTVNSAWSALTTGAWCNYNNDANNVAKYGRLYNWYAVNTGKLAPAGWHVPTDSEWITLENYLIANGYNYDGTTTGNKIAKSFASKTDWAASTSTGVIGNDLSKNNSSGFSALPGGYRYSLFYNLSIGGYWWSATENTTVNAWFRSLYNLYANLYTYSGSKGNGNSVRCIKDY